MLSRDPPSAYDFVTVVKHRRLPRCHCALRFIEGGSGFVYAALFKGRPSRLVPVSNLHSHPHRSR